MANYAVTDTVATYNTVTEAAAALETAVETLDSTNNPIVLSQIIPTKDGKFTLVLVA